jgi:hypothetical protein
MPDGQYSPTSNTSKIGVDLDILGKEVHGGPGLSENAQNTLEELLELNNLMAKSLILDEPDLSKKIGVVRANRTTTGIQTWNRFAAMYTIGSNKGGSCAITFETRDLLGRIFERMRINGAGDVGIGTSAPNVKLEVQGDVRIDDNTLYLRRNNDPNHGLGWFGSGKLFANNNVDGPVLFGFSGGVLGTTNGGQKVAMSWNKDGNVGIGISDPKAKLHVEATDKPTIMAQSSFGGLVSGSNGGHGVFGTNIYMNSNNQLKTAGTHNANYGYAGMHTTWGNIHFYAAGGNTTENGSISPVSRLFIRGSDGFVGIGVTSPKYQLDVNGTINASADVVVGGGDCAEEFDVVNAESIEPGTVMVIDNDGVLKASEKAYDKRVAGVISGGGDLRPGITLDKQTNKSSRLPVALNGKVYCKVDADCSAVEVGDLLTTSPTYGHAMKVSDHVKSIGAIIGKALRPLESGCGLIPILVALQ